MFEHMLLSTGGTHQGRDAVFAFAGELGVLAIATLAMAYYDVLPMKLPQAMVPVYLGAPPPPPPPAAAPRAPAQVVVNKLAPRTFIAPAPTVAAIPQHAAIIVDAAPALQDVAGGVPGGVPGGMPGGSLNGLLGALPPPAPVAAKAPTPAAAPTVPTVPTQLHVGGDVQAGLLTHEVVPVYPSIAKSARVQGTVKLSAIIAPDGTVKDLRVISGNPLLVEAAQNAVKQWVYRPTYLNGTAVEVITQIEVRFTLAFSGI